MSETAEQPQPEQQPPEQPEEQPPEQPEEQPPEQPEEPAERVAEQAAALSERDMERAVKRLETEATRHRSRVWDIMGADAEALIVCELCEPAIPGFRWPQAPEHDQAQRVLAAVGLGGLAERQHDPEAETCDLCEGHGELVTGSKVATQLTRPCPKCSANGWTTREQRNAWDSTERAKGAAAELHTITPAQAPDEPKLPPVDAWGRPVGHEFYGRNPTYMTAEQRGRDVPGAA